MAHGTISTSTPDQRVTATAVDSRDDLRDRVRDASTRRAAVRIAGSGTWLSAGRPTNAADVISVRKLAGITEYVPGDLTLTASAGTTLAEIADATSRHGQWLALDPYGLNDGSVGATVATASSGPLAAAFGLPRDLVLGVEFIMGTGIVARGGGRVVKNVAGFDLTRLITGSWGTLGIITEVTLRLHARPAGDESFAIALDDEESVERVRRVLRRLPFTPYACQIVQGLEGTDFPEIAGLTALFRLGGNAASVRAQRAALSELGGPRPVEATVWNRLRRSEPERAAVFRLSRSASEIAHTWRDALAIAAACPGTVLDAAPARGIVRCVVPERDATLAELRTLLGSAADAVRIGERVPAVLWPMLSLPRTDTLAIGIKRAFDPYSILNTGILGEAA